MSPQFKINVNGDLKKIPSFFPQDSTEFNSTVIDLLTQCVTDGGRRGGNPMGKRGLLMLEFAVFQ